VQRVVVNGVKSSWWPVTVVSPRAQFWVRSCLTSLSMIWMRGLSASFRKFADGIKLGGSIDLLEG